MKTVFFCDNKKKASLVYSGGTGEKIAAAAGSEFVFYGSDDLGKTDFSDTERIFSTWGMPALTEEQIKTYFPSLRGIYYAAGTVQAFARPFLSCGVRVFSAWQANAVPVIEYATSQILLASKGFFSVSGPKSGPDDIRASKKVFALYPGNYDAKVGILGDGAIGSKVILELLRHRLEVYVFSITMTKERADELGVRLASPEEIFAECDVISNHLANNERTKGLINRSLLSSMKDTAVFINTGRGAQVDEDALCDALEARPNACAVLDVTFPEPPLQGSRLYSLRNVILTPHIAGSSGNEVRRMAEYMYEEYVRVSSGRDPLYEVTAEMLGTMA